MNPFARIGFGMVCAVALAGCGGAWSTPTTTRASSPTTSSTVPTSAASTCRRAQLRASSMFVSPATGEEAVMIRLTNKGTAACSLDGYLRIQLLTNSGDVLAMPQSTVPQGPYFKVVKPRLVRLDSQSSAYVEVAKYRCDLGELQRSRMLRFVLPGSAFNRANWFVLGDVDVFARCKTGDGLPGNSFAATPIVASRAAIFP